MDSTVPDLPSRYRILEKYSGHTPKLGKSAGEELNWAYRIEDSDNAKEYIAMFCKPAHYTIIDTATWLELKKDHANVTWYYAPNGYISRTTHKGDKIPYVYLHQFILKYSGHGKGKNSIDHIHGQSELEKRLDNRLSNLRITTQSVQNENRGKVSRNCNARKLPVGITELPKFIVYYKECYNKEKNSMREFFAVEGHPKLKGKREATSKSNKISIISKLKEAKDIIAKLENTYVDPIQVIEVPEQSIQVVEQPIQTICKAEPLQWKISNIYRILSSGNYSSYLIYLQENNKQPDIEEKLNILITSIKGATEEVAKAFIKKFVEDLRTVRHNTLCYSKNEAVLLREDREHWNSQSVLRAFEANMLTKFKEHTEKNTGESPDDPDWSKRWTSFIDCVLKEVDSVKKKAIISKFLTAQRTKRFRKSKSTQQDS